MPQFLALVCDGDHPRDVMVRALASAGCRIRHCAGPAALATEARRVEPDLVVIGFTESESRAALAAADSLHAANRRLPVLFVTNDTSERTLIAAIRAGIKDCFREPLDTAELVAGVRRCLAEAALRTSSTNPVRASPAAREPAFVCASPSMRSIGDHLSRLAQHDSNVLITGETGTGKELAAARIHNQSARRGGRFVSVNCAAIPDALLESELFGYESGAFTGAVRSRSGLLQLANCGTVFLDEVGDLQPQAQAKILRAIEVREVFKLGGKRPEKLDVRVVAATNQDLEQAVEDGRFRQDLYFRLNVARVHLPPLRERRSDIVPLLDHYLEALGRRCARPIAGFNAQAIAALQAYDWPGNVRELKNLVEALLVSSPPGEIAVDDLPEDFRRRLQRPSRLPETERRRLLDALFNASWNKSRAAQILHCSRMTLYRRMSKYSVAGRDDAPAKMSHGKVTASRRKAAG